MMPRINTYGPFQSRRLGLSLGVNILSNHKICTYNCAYCELGLTNRDQIVSPEYRLKKKPTLNFRKELIYNLTPNNTIICRILSKAYLKNEQIEESKQFIKKSIENLDQVNNDYLSK